MTVKEAVREHSEGDFFDEFGYVLGIDMSENGDESTDCFTAVTEGVSFVSADFSPRAVIRDYVDGDRAVPVSARGEITVRFLQISGDAVQEKILDCAKKGLPLRCVYTSCCGTVFEGKMLVSSAAAYPSELCGREVKAVFTVC